MKSVLGKLRKIDCLWIFHCNFIPGALETQIHACLLANTPHLMYMCWDTHTGKGFIIVMQIYLLTKDRNAKLSKEFINSELWKKMHEDERKHCLNFLWNYLNCYLCLGLQSFCCHLTCIFLSKNEKFSWP